MVQAVTPVLIFFHSLSSALALCSIKAVSLCARLAKSHTDPLFALFGLLCVTRVLRQVLIWLVIVAFALGSVSATYACFYALLTNIPCIRSRYTLSLVLCLFLSLSLPISFLSHCRPSDH